MAATLSSAEWDALLGEGWAPPPGAERPDEETATDLVNVPNLLSVLGCAATCAWLAGGSIWWLVLGLGLDELDGTVARELGQETRFGAQLDWTIDVATMGAIAVKLGGPFPWSIPLVTLAQAYMRERGQRPAFGSARAGMVLLGLPGMPLG